MSSYPYQRAGGISYLLIIKALSSTLKLRFIKSRGGCNLNPANEHSKTIQGWKIILTFAIDVLVASLVYISESVFRQPLLEIWTISNKTRVRSLTLRSSIDYAVGGLLLICTSYQAGVEYDCGFESYVCPERPTEVTKTASHFFVVYHINRIGAGR